MIMKKGRHGWSEPDPKSFVNAALLIEHHDDFKGLFGQIGHRKVPMLIRHPHWTINPSSRLLPVDVDKEIVLCVMMHLERMGFSPKQSDVKDAIVLAAAKNVISLPEK